LWLKILKKLRTASLNPEFTGSYKKSVLKNDKYDRLLMGSAFGPETLLKARPEPSPTYNTAGNAVAMHEN